jgi:preprotein translocase subunit SecB
MKHSPLQLNQHFFTKVHLDAHADGKPTAEGQMECQVETGVAVHDPSVHQVTLRVKLVAKGKENPTYTGEIHAVGIFQVAPDWPKEKTAALVEVNGASVLFGTVREMVCNLTARGPWPMLRLGTYRFGASKPPESAGPAKPRSTTPAKPLPRA